MNPSEKLAGCRGLAGKIFGHRFQPRYDEKFTGAAQAVKPFEVVWHEALQTGQAALDGVPQGIMSSIKALGSAEEVYVHDVCTRCGAVVEKRSVTKL
jgi:hypothetical protein